MGTASTVALLLGFIDESKCAANMRCVYFIINNDER